MNNLVTDGRSMFYNNLTIKLPLELRATICEYLDRQSDAMLWLLITSVRDYMFYPAVVCLSLCSEWEMHITAHGPVSEMTYTVSNGTLNPSIPYLCVRR